MNLSQSGLSLYFNGIIQGKIKAFEIPKFLYGLNFSVLTNKTTKSEALILISLFLNI